MISEAVYSPQHHNTGTFGYARHVCEPLYRSPSRTGGWILFLAGVGGQGPRSRRVCAISRQNHFPCPAVSMRTSWAHSGPAKSGNNHQEHAGMVVVGNKTSRPEEAVRAAVGHRIWQRPGQWGGAEGQAKGRADSLHQATSPVVNRATRIKYSHPPNFRHGQSSISSSPSPRLLPN